MAEDKRKISDDDIALRELLGDRTARGITPLPYRTGKKKSPLPDPGPDDSPAVAKAKADLKYPKRGKRHPPAWWGVMCPWFKHHSKSVDRTFTVADFAKLAGVEKRQTQKMNAKYGGVSFT